MLERRVLQIGFLISQDFRQKLQLLQSAGQISREKMGDSASYLQCLVDEYLFLEANVPRVGVVDKCPEPPAGLRNGKPVRVVRRLTEKETLTEESNI